MKKSECFYQKMDPARVALLFGISLGLGIALHEVFFFVAGAIGVGALAALIANAIQDHTQESGHLTPNQR